MPTELYACHAHHTAPIYPSHATPTNQNPLIPDSTIGGTTLAKALKRVKIVHTVEPDNGQVLSRYKIGYYLIGERNKSDAPVSHCKLPQAYGKTEDVWRCAKKGCLLAKAHGFFNITTKKWYKDKGTVITPSPQIAAVSASVADSEPLRSTADEYLIINPVILPKYSTAPYNIPTPPTSDISAYPPAQETSTRWQAPPTAQRTPVGDQYSVSPPPQRKRKMSGGEYEDHGAKRLRNEIH
ncbi:hypothetical protein LTR74_000272 [Friedmanniomyces endolithicus]|nr:hypothetical protein LTR74_000272 [Friedmanniomyces endolithicus]